MNLERSTVLDTLRVCANYLIVVMHIHVDPEISVKEAYDISSEVEQKILEIPEVRYVTVKPCPSSEYHHDKR